MRTNTQYGEQLQRLRDLLFQGRNLVLGGFTGTPILNEPKEGRQLPAARRRLGPGRAGFPDLSVPEPARAEDTHLDAISRLDTTDGARCASVSLSVAAAERLTRRLEARAADTSMPSLGACTTER